MPNVSKMLLFLAEEKDKEEYLFNTIYQTLSARVKDEWTIEDIALELGYDLDKNLTLTLNTIRKLHLAGLIKFNSTKTQFSLNSHTLNG
jgi:hypothetical protein